MFHRGVVPELDSARAFLARVDAVPEAEVKGTINHQNAILGDDRS